MLNAFLTDWVSSWENWMIDRVLEYLRGNTEDPEVEKHLEECGECRALVEGYLEKGKELDIPEAGYGGTDEGLKERVVHFEKGTRRIDHASESRFITGRYSSNTPGIIRSFRRKRLIDPQLI